ncbi:MauE/DoxX family redox-associated membrane protein [Nanoarchaeota archaeon]
MIFDPTLVLIVKYIIAIFFIITGILKIPHLKDFYIIVLEYQIIKKPLAKIFAYTLPFIEIIIGGLLIANIFPFYITLIIFLLTTSNLIAIAFVLIRKLNIQNCGCYGLAIKSPVNNLKLVENICWFLLTLYIFLATII